MKNTTTLILFVLVSLFASGQSHFPYDSLRHVVIYDQSFKINPKAKADDIYAASLAWFNDASKFTRKNAMAPLDTVTTARKNKRKIEAEEQFANPRPLQMQDPAGSNIQGMGIIRYYGTSNSIKLLYIKYDIGVKVRADAATICISNIHYFHFNAGSYKQIPLYNFSGGTPCEEVGSLESLAGCERFHEEFKALALYCNKEIYAQIGDYKHMLQQKKYLYDAKPASPASAKATSKPSSKTTLKRK